MGLRMITKTLEYHEKRKAEGKDGEDDDSDWFLFP